MNNNHHDEAALVGTFAKTSYITIGTKEKPEEYSKKNPPRSAYTGKNFATAPPREGKTNDVYFEKKHNWVFDSDKFAEVTHYKDAGQEKKRGFLTSDFSKRDEFSNTIRTEQWREQLGKESKLIAKDLEKLSKSAEAMGDREPVETTTTRGGKEEFLYDAVFEKEDPGFSGASRTHRDTKNKTLLSLDRSLGQQITTNTLAYSAPTDFTKPQHARKPLVRDTFYRQTNIQYPQGCAASNGAEDD